MQYRRKKETVNINAREGVIGNKKTNITGDMYVTREYGKKTVGVQRRSARETMS